MHYTSRASVELVWDHRRQGTATASTGNTVTVGEPTNFSPDELLATAAASCLMQTFLRTTEEGGRPILSYASTAHVEASPDSNDRPRVHVRVFIVAPAGTVAADLLELFDRAASQSTIARLLGDRAVLTADVRVLRGVEGARA